MESEVRRLILLYCLYSKYKSGACSWLAYLSTKTAQIRLPVPVKLTNKHVWSCLFNHYKIQSVEFTNSPFYGEWCARYFSARSSLLATSRDRAVLIFSSHSERKRRIKSPQIVSSLHCLQNCLIYKTHSDRLHPHDLGLNLPQVGQYADSKSVIEMKAATESR